MASSHPPATRSAVTRAAFYGVSFNTTDMSVRTFTYKDLDRELADDAVFSWIDLDAPTIDPLNDVLRRWDIDLMLVNRFHEPEVLPRIVERPDCLAFYLYEIVDPEKHLDTSHGLSEMKFARMILILGRDFVITYHQHRLDAVDAVKESCADAFQLAGKTPGFIAFLFLQRCLYDYAHVNLASDNSLDELHSLLGRRDPELESKIEIAGRNILTLKKLAASLQIVLMMLVTKRNRFISDGARLSFGELLQNAVSIRAAVDSSRDLLDGVVASIQASAANRTSDIARVLTVVSAIILPLSLISGIYGMNFEFMPELRHPAGYYAVLSFMAALAALLLGVFLRLGWLFEGKGRRRRARGFHDPQT